MKTMPVWRKPVAARGDQSPIYGKPPNPNPNPNQNPEPAGAAPAAALCATPGEAPEANPASPAAVPAALADGAANREDPARVEKARRRTWGRKPADWLPTGRRQHAR